MRSAFTLAEVLITLGIIGVVAALTLPTVINNIQNRELETALKKSYSVLQNAVNQANYDSGEVIKPSNSTSGSLIHKIKPYLRVAENCGTAKCESQWGTSEDGEKVFNYSDRYQTYNNATKMRNNLLDDGQAILTDSMFIMVECSETPAVQLLITVDVNGLNKRPNRWGHDLFTFQITNEGKFLPAGAPGTGAAGANYANKENYCSKTSTSSQTGLGCTYWALTDKNYWKNLPR